MRLDWLCVEKQSLLNCRHCKSTVAFPSCTIINATDWVLGLWDLVCGECGRKFLISDVFSIGGYFINGEESVKTLNNAIGYAEDIVLEQIN
jgi:hypothetical protein